jgi:hypothetical protein
VVVAKCGSAVSAEVTFPVIAKRTVLVTAGLPALGEAPGAWDAGAAGDPGVVVGTHAAKAVAVVPSEAAFRKSRRLIRRSKAVISCTPPPGSMAECLRQPFVSVSSS